MTARFGGKESERSMIEENWQSMQSTRRRTLKMVRRVSQEQSEFAPAADRWSVGEVLDHLLLADRFCRREISALLKLARSGEATVLTRRMEEIDVSLALIPRGLLPMLEIPLSVLNPFVPKATGRRIQNKTPGEGKFEIQGIS